MSPSGDGPLSAAELDAVLDAVRAGRTDLFARVVREYALPVRAYLAGQMHHRADVDDIAQDVFLAALETLSSYRRGDEFWAWLRGIARHKVLNHHRGGTRRGQMLDRFRREVFRRLDAEYEQLAADRAEEIERLLLCITRLPDRLRAVVRAGLDGAKAADTAATLGTTVGAIYTMHYRANQLLRACVENRGERP